MSLSASSLYDTATPVIAQYLHIKAGHKNCLLLFRMGDFYELFFEDAEIAAKELDIVLTKRGKYQDQDIKMCGVPVHNYNHYVERLVKKGYAIAVCEQLENPSEAKKRGAKSVVHRDVVRIITAGTLTEDHLLDPSLGNYIVAFLRHDDKICVFRYDISTGKNFYSIIGTEEFSHIITRINPAEIIGHTADDSVFLKKNAPDYPHDILDHIITPTEELTEFTKDFADFEKQTFLLLYSYIVKTQKHSKPLLLPTIFENHQGRLQLDSATYKNLEIFETSDGSRKNTLFWVLDNMVTRAGARLLHERLIAPLMDRQALNERYDAIDFFIQNDIIAKKIREGFKQTADIARIIGRVQAGRGTPADLGNLKDSLTTVYTTLEQSHFEKCDTLPPLILGAYQILCRDFACYHALYHALAEHPPITLKFGGFIKAGYDAVLDEYLNLKDNAREIILGLENKYRTLTSIQALKIKHNNVIGYHIDVPSSHADKMLTEHYDDVSFIHKQTLAGHIRFTTTELMSLEKRIFEAEANFNARENELFQNLVAIVCKDALELSNFADSIAQMDLYASHASLATDYDYTRPILLDKKAFHLTKARHPVIEHILKNSNHKPFSPNDCQFLAPKKPTELWLVSGPNMGGKSTYLRQNALLIIMTQAGFYVPCASYRAGLFDRVFSRVGASDNLAKGHSTFMTEMSETALILKTATSRSFIILDELGRGTSTYDGLAIAFATTQYLISHIHCLTLFATHYHELTDLTTQSKHIGHLQVTVSEYKNEIIFLHHIIQGAAKKSYGIHVASLAGMPAAVVKMAQDFLNKTDKTGRITVPDNTPSPLFMPLMATHIPAHFQEMEHILKNITIDHLTPIEAFAILSKLKESVCEKALQGG